MRVVAFVAASWFIWSLFGGVGWRIVAWIGAGWRNCGAT